MPNASYNVTLFFAEIYWNGPGLRLFNISANNKTVILDFDIFATAGRRSFCMRRTYICMVLDGEQQMGRKFNLTFLA